MLYTNIGVTEDGVDFTQMGSKVWYVLKNEEEYRKLVNNFNSQLGFEWYQLEKVSYPYTLQVDTDDMLLRKYKGKGKFHALDSVEYNECYVRDVKEHIVDLVNWIKGHKKAKLSTCEKYFEKDNIFNLEENETKFEFDSYYGPIGVSIIGTSDGLKLWKTLELYDASGFSGFSVTEESEQEIRAFWKEIFGASADTYLITA